MNQRVQIFAMTYKSTHHEVHPLMDLISRPSSFSLSPTPSLSASRASAEYLGNLAAGGKDPRMKDVDPESRLHHSKRYQFRIMAERDEFFEEPRKVLWF